MNADQSSQKAKNSPDAQTELAYLDKLIDHTIKIERSALLRKTEEERDLSTIYFPIFLYVCALILASTLIIMSFKTLSFYLSQGSWGF